MRVLVAGGAGYIGSHTCKELAAAGHVPVVFDNLESGHDWARLAPDWRPRHFDLDTVIETAWRWMTEHRSRAMRRAA